VDEGSAKSGEMVPAWCRW